MCGSKKIKALDVEICKKNSLNCIMSYQATLEGSKFDTKIYKSIFLGNLSITQIMDSNGFLGQKKFPKILLSWFDSYRNSSDMKENSQ